MSEPRPHPWRTAILAAVLIALVGAGVAAAIVGWKRYVGRPPLVLRIATGGKGGTYLPLGRAIAEVVNARVPGVRAEALESAGSKDNMRRLEAGEVELALVQNDTAGGENVRAIAPLYQEILQVVVRGAAAIADPIDLRGKRISVGPQGGGTEGVARVVFAHFGLRDEDLDLRHLPLSDAVSAFERGEIDAVFVLAGLRAPALERMLAAPGARLLSLGDPLRAGSSIEGLRINAPFLSPAVIPERVYGPTPPGPAGTLAVWALLVARSDLPDGVVRDLTRAIFDSKVKLAEQQRVVGRLSERFDPGEIRFPLHAGATQYYHRDDPAFIKEWAEPISLGITVVLLAGSAVLTLREALKRNKKNRIDVYYLQIQEWASHIGADTPLEELQAIKEKLQRLRRRAFEELVAERLEANESFTIFQDYLRSELGEVEAAIRARQQQQVPA